MIMLFSFILLFVVMLPPYGINTDWPVVGVSRTSFKCKTREVAYCITYCIIVLSAYILLRVDYIMQQSRVLCRKCKVARRIPGRRWTSRGQSSRSCDDFI